MSEVAAVATFIVVALTAFVLAGAAVAVAVTATVDAAAWWVHRRHRARRRV